MIQQRLRPLGIKRERPDYPQVDYFKNNIQYIELNRGCKRGCVFCWADPNYKEFPIPEIRSNKVQIIGEGFLYDSQIKDKLNWLSLQKVNNKVVYYGLGNGVDYRLLTPVLARLLKNARIGRINNKGNWYKGICLAWDTPLSEEPKIKKALDLFKSVGYDHRYSKIFMLVNWKTPFKDCLYKLNKLKEWGVLVDDCTWECTKKLFIPQYWDYKEYKLFRKLCRSHNIDIIKGKWTM